MKLNLNQQIPWPRVLAEGLIIVVSILLAFSIDAWWSDRQEREQEQEVLNGLATDFAVNHSELETAISHHLWGVNLIFKLNTLSQEEVALVSPESTEEYIRAIVDRASFDPQNGTLDALIASGKLGIISDPKLRTLLVEWKNLLEDALEEKNIIQDQSEKVLDQSNKAGRTLENQYSGCFFKS